MGDSTAIAKYIEYLRNTGQKVPFEQSGFVIRRDMPLLRCSPDGKIIDPTSHPHYGVIEVNCPYKYRHISPKSAAVGILISTSKKMGMIFL